AYPERSVLIAEDLTASDAAAMEPGTVVGFATLRGGATSHVAIPARSLGIPAVAGIEPRALDIPNGTPVILDGTKGSLRLSPPAAGIPRTPGVQARLATPREQYMAHALEPAVTKDGRHVFVFANIEGIKQAQQVAS